MNTVVDIVGSAVITGIVLLLLIRMNRSMGDTTLQNTLDVVTQENSKAIADMINYDFYKIGYHDILTNPNPIIQYADTDQIVFRGDVDTTNATVIDTVHYFVSSAPYYAHGSSTKFRKLYRLVNASTGAGASLGITSFKLTYYDTSGRQIVFPTPTDSGSRARTKSIKIQMTVKNPIAADSTLASTYDTTFASTYWEKWISPKNLRVLK